MSYDLAVWEGARPANDVDAGDMYEALFDRYLEVDNPMTPSDRIRAYVYEVIQRYPDTTDESPWSSTPIIDDGAGPIVYLTMVWSRCEEVSAWLAQLAVKHDLVYYDPQMERLRA